MGVAVGGGLYAHSDSDNIAFLGPLCWFLIPQPPRPLLLRFFPFSHRGVPVLTPAPLWRVDRGGG